MSVSNDMPRPVPQRDGPRFASFDVDGTLVPYVTIVEFERFWLRETAGETAEHDFMQWRRVIAGELSRADINRLLALRYRGRRSADVAAMSERWFRGVQWCHGRGYLRGPLSLLRRLIGEGYTPVLVTGSPAAVVAPIARQLGVSEVLGLDLAVSEGAYTGQIVPPQTIGRGKALSLQALAAARGVDLKRSVACADHLSDLELLSTAGDAYVVEGDGHLEAVARARGWTVIRRDGGTL